jgi:MFS family permease
LFFLGAGLAPGFPVMLGVIAEIFKNVSATAFSFAMVIALSGNIIINYLTGVFVDKFGAGVYLYIVLIEIIAMVIVFRLIRVSEKNRVSENSHSGQCSGPC